MGSKTDEIRQYIFNTLQMAKSEGLSTKDIRAGDIKKEMHLGNVPQLVCNAMRSIPHFTKYDILFAPPSGNSTTLLLRYYLDDTPFSSELSTDLENHPQNRRMDIHKYVSIPENEINIDSLLNNVLVFYNKLNTIENHRYRSWEHCYSFFQKHQNAENEEVLDLMCLHLSNYLASWGMFRGALMMMSTLIKCLNSAKKLQKSIERKRLTLRMKMAEILLTH